MKTAFVTGANGFIGSRLVLLMLAGGWIVNALGRGSGGLPFKDRLTAALTDVTGQPQQPRLLQNLRCLDADLTKPDLGLGQPAPPGGSGQDAVLFHVAGDTRFNPPDPAAQRRVNIDASLNIMKYLRGSVTHAVHVSTAYVAGDRTGTVGEDELDLGQDFRNCYEKSKLDAETAVSELCRRLDMPLCIVRPSIISNDTATGRSSTFTHLNALVEVVSRIQEHYGLDDGEVISNAIRLPVNPDARPNLAPVDPIAGALLEIGANCKSAGRTFHLCHPSPQANSEIVSLIATAFGVADKLRLPFVDAIPANPTWTEKMMLRSLKPYLPYLNGSAVFDLANTRSFIPDYDSRFQPVTVEYIRKVIEFQRLQRPRTR